MLSLTSPTALLSSSRGLLLSFGSRCSSGSSSLFSPSTCAPPARRRAVVGGVLSGVATLSVTVLVFSLLPVTSRSYSTTSSWNNMAPYSTERNGDGTIVVSPKNEADQSALVVISHGLGDSAEGFADVAEHLASKLPWIKFILPTAPVQPVTINGGMRMNSWYDIVGLDERSNENCAGIEESQARLEGILDQEHKTSQLSYQRMVLAGFSQGGSLSLFTGLQLPPSKKLAAIVVLSGYLPAASKVSIPADSAVASTPVWHGHGTQDMVVAHGLAAKSKAAVAAKGHTGDYILQSYPLGHMVNMDEIGDVEQFLRRVLPDDETCKITLKDPNDMSVKELKQAIRKAGLSREATGFTEKSEFVKLLNEHRATSSKPH